MHKNLKQKCIMKLRIIDKVVGLIDKAKNVKDAQKIDLEYSKLEAIIQKDE
jgi:hypothetical protein